jgi:hypothetical protein
MKQKHLNRGVDGETEALEAATTPPKVQPSDSQPQCESVPPALAVRPNPMMPVTSDIIARAVDILGADDLSEDEVESRVAGLVADSMTATRLIDWIPEAFGFVWVSQLSTTTMPTAFGAQKASGEWEESPLTSEPIFTAALPIAQAMLKDGPHAMFHKISTQSCLANAFRRSLDKGCPIDGGVLEGPCLLRIPAEVYHAAKRSFWRKLLSLSAAVCALTGCDRKQVATPVQSHEREYPAPDRGLMDFVKGLYEAHGAKAELVGDWINVDGGRLRTRAAHFDHAQGAKDLILQADFITALPSGEHIVESFHG